MTAPAVLLPYQQSWLADPAPVKVCEKSRRVGLSWSEGGDCSLIAAASREAGGMDCWYVGYNQDMAKEFVRDAAFWARHYQLAVEDSGQEVLIDEDKDILTYYIRLASGFRVTALSSRPSNLRGKQGLVVVDEAAFHDDLDGLIKAAVALLMWGGKLRIISTHNGDTNGFNELVLDIRAGKKPYSIHRVDFQKAVAQGLYQRICLKAGKIWSPEAEREWVAEMYRFYGEHAAEELDVIPSSGSGRYLTRAMVEANTNPKIEVLRLSMPAEFVHQTAHAREAEVRDWCERELAPRIARLDPFLRTYLGEDFARSGDVSGLWPIQVQHDLTKKTPFVVELRNVPFEQQKQIVFFLIDRLPRFAGGAFDARGNGQYLAEVTMQKYGAALIVQVMLSAEWYRENMPRFKAAFEDRNVDVPRDDDVVSDMLLVRMDKGIAKVPDDARVRGADGMYRHGDTAIALALALFAAATIEGAAIDYTPAPPKISRWDYDPEQDRDRAPVGDGAW